MSGFIVEFSGGASGARSVIGLYRAAEGRLRKVIDDETLVSCAAGSGLIREEVWVDDEGEVGRYNLAFINHFLAHGDNGRVLGYDDAHGQAHRHYYGAVEEAERESYPIVLERFLLEVAELRTWTQKET